MKTAFFYLIATLFLGAVVSAQNIPRAEEDRFLAGFKQAVENRDSTRLQEMVCWGDANDFSREDLKAELRACLTQSVTKVELAILLTGDNTWPPRSMFHPAPLTLTPEKVVCVEFEKGRSSSFLLGLKDGKLLIACPKLDSP